MVKPQPVDTLGNRVLKRAWMTFGFLFVIGLIYGCLDAVWHWVFG